MRLTDSQAVDLLRSDDLIGVGMEADAVRRKLHPGGVATYIIDRNINYTNFCTEYCSFCAFYRPMGHSEGYILSRETLHQKIQETIDLGGTGVLMQGGLHPHLKIEWYEELLRDLKANFKIHLHALSAPEILNIAEVSGISLEETLIRLRDAGLDSIPGAGAEILDDEVRYKIARLKCKSSEWIDLHRMAHKLGMRTTGEHEADAVLKVYTALMIRNTANAFSFWSQCFFEDFNQFYNLDKAISYADKSLVLYKARF